MNYNLQQYEQPFPGPVHFDFLSLMRIQFVGSSVNNSHNETLICD